MGKPPARTSRKGKDENKVTIRKRKDERGPTREFRVQRSEGDGVIAGAEKFMAISPADFFYRNRDLAGFSNPSRAVYATIRELVENSLDACESYGIPPEIYVRLRQEGGEDTKGGAIYRIRVADNGSGIPPENVPKAFGQILYGSKYTLRQVRGTFGLGGKMAILYGQITTHSSARIITSTGEANTYEFEVAIDIQRNEPKWEEKSSHEGPKGWHGTIVEFSFEGDYVRAMPKILDYFKQTAMVCPYANITFVDPKGRLYRLDRVTKKMPNPPRETKPHPYGIDVETLQRIVGVTEAKNMVSFMTNHFHRVGKSIAQSFLKQAGFDEERSLKRLSPSDEVKLVQSMRGFKGFLPPDASCLSPVGEELLRAGIVKELSPEFVEVVQMRPDAYSGYPFIVEVGIAYGGGVPSTPGITLYRFANRIPLLYDEASDVARLVVDGKVEDPGEENHHKDDDSKDDSGKGHRRKGSTIDWGYYKVTPDMPVVLIVHVCSTKVPYKTVGKEFIADRPEVVHMLYKGIREVARRLRFFLSKKISFEYEKRRLSTFSKYLPKIAEFSTELAGRDKVPEVSPLLRILRRYGGDEGEE